jgi:hypothetical protein
LKKKIENREQKIENRKMKKLIFLFFTFLTAFGYSQPKNINSLIGQDYSILGNEVVFEDYSIKNIGGYLLPKDGFDADFGIAEFWSSEKRFLLFFRIDDSKQIITNVLEIDKKDLQNKKTTEYCSTKNGFDSEIIAIVKDSDSEFYTEIVKAWKANRKTGKFEKVSKRKIKKCGNESYGI